MPTLYVTQNDAVLRLAAGRLVVDQRGKATLCVGLREVENVLVFGNAQVTTAAISALLAQGSPLAFLTTTGRLKGRLVSAVEKNASRRLRQFECHRDEAFQLDFARRAVRGKITNARAVINRLARNCPSASPRGLLLREAARQLKHRTESVRQSRTLEILRGVEGAAASVYFAALREAGARSLGFERRGKRPSPDPFNALLNLGYTLAGHEVLTALSASGLDATLGFYHVEALGRPALALDLLEEFRAPLIDRWALTLCNRRIIENSDFERVQGDFRLTNPALRRVLSQYEEDVMRSFKDARTGAKVTFRSLFLLQARRLIHCVEEGTSYIPYRHK